MWQGFIPVLLGRGLVGPAVRYLLPAPSLVSLSSQDLHDCLVFSTGDLGMITFPEMPGACARQQGQVLSHHSSQGPWRDLSPRALVMRFQVVEVGEHCHGFMMFLKTPARSAVAYHCVTVPVAFTCISCSSGPAHITGRRSAP